MVSRSGNRSSALRLRFLARCFLSGPLHGSNIDDEQTHRHPHLPTGTGRGAAGGRLAFVRVVTVLCFVPRSGIFD